MNDTLLTRSTGVAPGRFDAFFRWVPDADLALDGETPDGRASLVVVTEDLVARHDTDMLPPGPAPAAGAYVRVVDPSGDVYAHAYADDAEAAEYDLREALALHHVQPRALRVVSADRAYQRQRPSAVLDVVGAHDYDAVLRAGLAAVGESPESLQDYGVTLDGHRLLPGTLVGDAAVTVFGVRD